MLAATTRTNDESIGQFQPGQYPAPTAAGTAKSDLITRLSSDTNTYETTKRRPSAFTPAEFAPAQGVLLTWTHSLLRSLIKTIARDDIAFVAIQPGERSQATAALRREGVNMANVQFIEAPLDAMWMRDYGPCFTYTPDGDLKVVDLIYNRPRPHDDNFPNVVAELHNLDVLHSDLTLPPGNLIISDGMAIMTDVVFDPAQGGDPNLTVPELERLMKEAFGVERVIMLRDMNDDGTGHVDMFCKMLDKETVIVGEYAHPRDGAPGNYEILNEAAARLANTVNGDGNKLNVIRVPMPPRQWGTTFTYTNSLIVNDKVLVPIYGFDADDDALAIYQRLMPNHEIIGFDANGIIDMNGAIHCITKLVMADPLQIAHTSIDSAHANEPVPVSIDVRAVNGLTEADATVYWSTSPNGPFEAVQMRAKSTSSEGGFNTTRFSGRIPAQPRGSEIFYYLRVDDDEGMYETFPEDAPRQSVCSISIGAPRRSPIATRLSNTLAA